MSEKHKQGNTCNLFSAVYDDDRQASQVRQATYTLFDVIHHPDFELGSAELLDLMALRWLALDVLLSQYDIETIHMMERGEISQVRIGE